MQFGSSKTQNSSGHMAREGCDASRTTGRAIVSAATALSLPAKEWEWGAASSPLRSISSLFSLCTTRECRIGFGFGISCRALLKKPLGPEVPRCL